MALSRKLLRRTAKKMKKEKKRPEKKINETKTLNIEMPKMRDIGSEEAAFEEEPEVDEIDDRVKNIKQEWEETGGKAKEETGTVVSKVIDFSTVKMEKGKIKPRVEVRMPLSDFSEMKKKIETIEKDSEMRNIPLKAHKIPMQYLKKMSSAWAPPEFTEVNQIYPLIKPFAYADLTWDKSEERLSYYILEPQLTEDQRRQLELIKEIVVDLLDINLFEVKAGALSVRDVLKEKVDKVIKDYGMQISEHEYQKILYYMYRDFLGLGTIESMMHDPNIEDISCDGVKIPLYIYHRKYASIPSNIMFPSEEVLNQFIIRLAQRCGKHISVADPLLDGALPDGSRVQATFSSHKDIAMHGSTFTIRKFTKDPLTITDLLNFGTLPEMIGAYLWMALEYRRSLLFAGGTATGKTSFLNAMSMFLPDEMKIISIEDTPEVRLPHQHWLQKVVRTGFGREDMTGRKSGEISMYDLLRAALRERPDEIIVGEVRGKEAFVLFQGMASVRGSERVLVLNGNGAPKRIPIKELMNTDLEGYKAVTIDPKTKEVKTLPLEACVEHEPRKELVRITTATGRQVEVTDDHSVFTINNGDIDETKAGQLKKGDDIIVPARLPCGYADIKHINLAEHLPGIRVIAPQYIKSAVKKLGWKKAGLAAGVKTISDYYGSGMSALHAKRYFKLLTAAGIINSPAKILVKYDRKSESMPAKLEVTDELLRLMGYYLSEGSLNTATKNNAIQLYNSNEKVLQDMRKCIKDVSGKEPRERITKGYGTCTELSFSHKVLFEFLKHSCDHGAAKKGVPDWVFGLSKERIGEMLSAMWTGDGYCSEKMFQYSTKSKRLADDMMQLLLCYGIVAHSYHTKEEMYRIEFYRRSEQEEFFNWVKPINKKVVFGAQGRKNPRLHEGIYVDKVKEVDKLTLDSAEAVYDLCVPGTQNFVGGFGGIMLHNTGHAGMATIHGDSVDAVMHRLQTPPINLSAGLLMHLNIIIVLTKARIKGVEVRRIKEVVEVLGLTKDQEPIINTLFRWDPATDTFEFASDKSYVFQKIIEDKGIKEKDIWEEVQRRTHILRWMKENNIRYYIDVGKIIQRYYSNPEEVLKNI